MATYCVTAVKRTNPNDDRVSHFDLWELTPDGQAWNSLEWKSLNYVAALLIKGNEVLSGTISNEKMETGYPLELELRIAKNDEDFKLTDMPEF